MNKNGDVRSASEFKDIFDETGDSYRPYSCPFCEVLYEDRCIITECVKAPHFKLPAGTFHLNGCNGEAIEESTTGRGRKPKAPERTIEGDMDVPEALVNRRAAVRVRKPGDDENNQSPDAAEIVRRRKIVSADRTLSSCYTASYLRPVIKAYKRLKKYAYTKASAAGNRPGTPMYKEHFRATLNAKVLSLYGQKLTYGNAFQGSRLSPWWSARIYFGNGVVRVDGQNLIIKDRDSWPKQLKGQDDLAIFEVVISRALAPDAPTSHIHALAELERLAAAGQEIEWYAYGLPVLQGDQFELRIATLDHLYWQGQYRR